LDKNSKKWRSWLQSIPAYIYLLPGFLIYAIFFLYPLGQLIYLSLTRWNGLGPKEFIGFKNYLELFTQDTRFWLSLQHNLLWMAASIFIPTLLGLLLAVFLVRSSLYGRVFFRTIFFLPQVLSSVAVAIVWRWIYNPSFGVVNTILKAIGLDFLAHSWLGDTATALPALFIAVTWIAYGFNMVIFIAALQSVDETYYDAAKVDGANSLQQFFHLTLPFIRGTLATVILISAIGAFEIFDLVFIITKGGPALSTMVLTLYMYDSAFRLAKYGYASAIAVMLGVIIFTFSCVFLYFRNKLDLESV
jgi:raffinose/stachyose/melibiose transport system permease protein